MNYAVIATLTDSTTTAYTYSEIGNTLNFLILPDNVESAKIGSGITSIVVDLMQGTESMKPSFTGFTYEDGLDIRFDLRVFYYTPSINREIRIDEPRIKKVFTGDSSSGYRFPPVKDLYIGEYACDVDIIAMNSTATTGAYVSLTGVTVEGDGNCDVYIATGLGGGTYNAPLSAVTMGNGVARLEIGGAISSVQDLNLSSSVKDLETRLNNLPDISAPGLEKFDWTVYDGAEAPSNYPNNARIIYGGYSSSLGSDRYGSVSYPNKCIFVNELRSATKLNGHLSSITFPSSIRSLAGEKRLTYSDVSRIHVGDKCTNVHEYYFGGGTLPSEVYFSCEKAEDEYKKNSYCGKQGFGSSSGGVISNYTVKGYTTAYIYAGTGYIRNGNIEGNGSTSAYTMQVGIYKTEGSEDWSRGQLNVGDGVVFLRCLMPQRLSAPVPYTRIGKDITRIETNAINFSDCIIYAETPPLVFSYTPNGVGGGTIGSRIYPNKCKVPSQSVSLYEAAGWTNVIGI